MREGSGTKVSKVVGGGGCGCGGGGECGRERGGEEGEEEGGMKDAASCQKRADFVCVCVCV